MDEKIFTAIIRVETKQETLITDVANIKSQMSTIPCKVNTYKIKILQRIVYGAVVIILLAFMVNLTDPARSDIGKMNKVKLPIKQEVKK